MSPAMEILALAEPGSGWKAMVAQGQVVATAEHDKDGATWGVQVRQVHRGATWGVQLRPPIGIGGPGGVGGRDDVVAIVVAGINNTEVDRRECRTVEDAVRVARWWWGNIRAGRSYLYEPRPMRDFAAKAWAPPGPRLHVLILPATATGTELVDRYGPTLAAHPDLIRTVPANRLHITLGWTPTPAIEITAAQRATLQESLRAALAPLAHGIETVEVLPPQVVDHGVRCDLSPPEPLENLIRVVTDQLRATLGAAQPTSLDPHLALAYSVADTDDAMPLVKQLRRREPRHLPPRILAHHPTLGDAHIVLVECDTFANNPWQWGPATVLTSSLTRDHGSQHRR